MVRFRYRTPFGIPVTHEDATAALQELRAADRYASVTREAVIQAMRTRSATTACFAPAAGGTSATATRPGSCRAISQRSARSPRSR
jgi:hypothetical protein